MRWSGIVPPCRDTPIADEVKELISLSAITRSKGTDVPSRVSGGRVWPALLLSACSRARPGVFSSSAR